MKYFAWYLLAINFLAWALCGIDKWKARRGSWRIPEKTLLLSAAAGGSIGFLIGMKIFHHKTKHKKFTLGVPVILLVQLCAAAAVIYYFYGKQ